MVKRTGDGVLVEFRSVVDAVRCGIEMQNGLIERNAGLPTDRRIEFRVGIHLGDVVEETDGDLMGDGVNIAARLEGIAKPGAIALSEDAYRQVKGRLDMSVSDLGEKELKNIAEPIRVYSLEVGRPLEAKPAPLESPAQRSGPPRCSIVVLPFANLGGGPEQENFADAVTESLTTDLSRMSNTVVVARNTAFTYKGKTVDAKQVGRELNVRYLLEGSIQRGANRMRVNAQLIDAASGNHIWADRFDKPMADLFDMQDEIVSYLANQLRAELIAAEAQRAELEPNPDSLDYYFRGVADFNKGRIRQSDQGARAVREGGRARRGQRRRACGRGAGRRAVCAFRLCRPGQVAGGGRGAAARRDSRSSRATIGRTSGWASFRFRPTAPLAVSANSNARSVSTAISASRTPGSVWRRSPSGAPRRPRPTSPKLFASRRATRWRSCGRTSRVWPSSISGRTRRRSISSDRRSTPVGTIR